MTYDKTLFAGTAAYYAKYRKPYPQALIDDIVSTFGLDGTGRMLDLGCGPGMLTLPLAPHFAEIVAFDADEGMIAEARKSDARNVDWRVGRAEDLPGGLGKFRLVTFAQSLHWMQQDVVMARVREMIEPGAGIALVGGSESWWDGPLDWHQVMTRMIQKYLGERRRAGANAFKEPHDPFEVILERHGWRIVLNRDYPVEIVRTADDLVGTLWTTSFANKALLGERVDEFERELRAELAALPGDGHFRTEGEFGQILARAPQ
jgi:trans-aconitate methyltransferase